MQTASDRKTTVFISYRRQGGFVLAKYIFDHLHAAGYDVFMDVQSLGAGEFEQTTLAGGRRAGLLPLGAHIRKPERDSP